MKKILSILLVAAALTDVSASAGDFPVNSRSRFEPAQVARNPFWPIGYVQKEKAAYTAKAAVRQNAKLSPDNFVVSSILIGGGLPLAVINGKEVAIGDQLAIQGATVQVVSILDGEVGVRFQDQTLSIPLRQR